MNHSRSHQIVHSLHACKTSDGAQPFASFLGSPRKITHSRRLRLGVKIFRLHAFQGPARRKHICNTGTGPLLAFSRNDLTADVRIQCALPPAAELFICATAPAGWPKDRICQPNQILYVAVARVVLERSNGSLQCIPAKWMGLALISSVRKDAECAYPRMHNAGTPQHH